MVRGCRGVGAALTRRCDFRVSAVLVGTAQASWLRKGGSHWGGGSPHVTLSPQVPR